MTKHIFEALFLNNDFLKQDSETWSNNSLYREFKQSVTKLCVTNYTAKKEMALIQEYNGLHTKSGEQSQFNLQVVEQYRKFLLSITKAVISKQI